MKIRVVDFETTGLPEDQVRAICEAGWTDISEDLSISMPQAVLVNPGHPIPPVTRAIHHISDADVADAISPPEAIELLMDGMEDGDMFAAHNAEFEQVFFSGGNHPWICTMKCAMHLFPEAPRFSNQVLRYWLGLDETKGFSHDLAMPPHKAGPDTYVTAHILARLALMAGFDELVTLTNTPVLLKVITFGKHKGENWADIPAGYLEWVISKSDRGPDEKHTARHYLGVKS